MKSKRVILMSCFLLAFLAVSFTMSTAKGSVAAIQQAGVGTGFTYQGRLTDGGVPADGTYNFRFYLWAEAGKISLEGTYPSVGTIPIQVTGVN